MFNDQFELWREQTNPIFYPTFTNQVGWNIGWNVENMVNWKWRLKKICYTCHVIWINWYRCWKIYSHKNQIVGKKERSVSVYFNNRWIKGRMGFKKMFRKSAEDFKFVLKHIIDITSPPAIRILCYSIRSKMCTNIRLTPQVTQCWMKTPFKPIRHEHYLHLSSWKSRPLIIKYSPVIMKINQIFFSQILEVFKKIQHFIEHAIISMFASAFKQDAWWIERSKGLNCKLKA